MLVFWASVPSVELSFLSRCSFLQGVKWCDDVVRCSCSPSFMCCECAVWCSYSPSFICCECAVRCSCSPSFTCSCDGLVEDFDDRWKTPQPRESNQVMTVGCSLLASPLWGRWSRPRSASRVRNKKMHSESGNIKMVVVNETPLQRRWPTLVGSD